MDLAVLKGSIMHSELTEATTSTFHRHPLKEADESTWKANKLFLVEVALPADCDLSLSFGLASVWGLMKPNICSQIRFYETFEQLQICFILCSWYDSECLRESVPVHSLVNVWFLCVWTQWAKR